MYRSPELIKASAAYQKRVAELKQEIKTKFQPVITGEKNLLKKLSLIRQKHLAIQREIHKLTSGDKLYIAAE